MASPSTELVAVRQEIAAAQAAGDQKTANSLYARSLELQQALALQQQPGQPGSAKSPSVLSAASALVDARARAQGQLDSLRDAGYATDVALLFEDSRWQGEDGPVEQLALASAFIADHQEMIATVERFGVSEVAALALASQAARAAGYRYSAPGSSQPPAQAAIGTQPANATERSHGTEQPAQAAIGHTPGSFEQRVERFRAEIAQLQAQGKNAAANALYVALQELRRQHGETGGIVDGRRVA